MAIQIVREVSTDVVRRGTTRAIYAKQNDLNSRFLNVLIQEDGKDIKVSENAEVLLNVERPDKQQNIFMGSVNKDGTVRIALTSWMLELAGTLLCDISVVSTEPEVRLSTMQFNIYVEEAVIPDAVFEETEEYSLIVDLLNRTSEAERRAVNAADEADRAKQAAQDSATAAEAVKVTCEDATAEAYRAAEEASAFEANLDVERKRINELAAMRSVNNITQYNVSVDGKFTLQIDSNGFVATVVLMAKEKIPAGYVFTFNEIPMELAPIRPGVELIDNDDAYIIMGESKDLGKVILSIRVKSNGKGIALNESYIESFALNNPTLPELADIRVGVNGEVYDNAGEAVRQQLKTLIPKVYTCSIGLGEDLETGEFFSEYTFDQDTQKAKEYIKGGGLAVLEYEEKRYPFEYFDSNDDMVFSDIDTNTAIKTILTVGTYSCTVTESQVKVEVVNSGVGRATPELGEIFNDYDTNKATGKFSRASGTGNTVSGHSGEAGGMNNTVKGAAAHGEGNENTVEANCGHVEGHGNKVTGYAAHAGGRITEARGHSSHASGKGTFASGAQQHVIGSFNIIDTMCEDGVTPLPTADDGLPEHQYGGNEYKERKSQYVRIVGNGTSHRDENNNIVPDRSNAETLDWKGNLWNAGNHTAKDFIIDGKQGNSLASLSGLMSAVGAMQNTLGNDIMVIKPTTAGSIVLQENTCYQFLGSSEKKTMKFYNSDNTVGKAITYQMLTIYCGSMTDNAEFGIEERMSPAYLYVVANDTKSDSILNPIPANETGCYAFKKYLPDSTEINPTFRAEVEYPANSVIIIQTKSNNHPHTIATLEEEV